MANFATEVLKPHLTEDALATAPVLPAAIENALTFPPTKGPSVFSRLASGPLYRGDIAAMLAVVAPETLEKFAIASQKVTSKEAMAAVIRDSAVDPARKKVCNGSRRRSQLIYASTVPQVDLLTQTGCRLEPDHTTINPHSNRPVDHTRIATLRPEHTKHTKQPAFGADPGCRSHCDAWRQSCRPQHRQRRKTVDRCANVLVSDVSAHCYLCNAPCGPIHNHADLCRPFKHMKAPKPI